MITTVGRAKMKWCPFDKKRDGRSETNCLGPDCMMWRFWIPPPGLDPTDKRPKHGQDDSDKKGYCGLSGGY